MIEKILDNLKEKFPGFTFKSEKDSKDEKKHTISAEQGWKKGFDVEVTEGSKAVTVSYTSKLRTIFYMAAFGVTVLLTYLYGGTILWKIGLVSDGGSTLRILYIIPVFIFFIPLFIISTVVANKVNPEDKELLEEVKNRLSDMGYEPTID